MHMSQSRLLGGGAGAASSTWDYFQGSTDRLDLSTPAALHLGDDRTSCFVSAFTVLLLLQRAAYRFNVAAWGVPSYSGSVPRNDMAAACSESVLMYLMVWVLLVTSGPTASKPGIVYYAV